MANRERVARLEALLARVRANARPGSLLSAREQPPADEAAARPVPMVPPPIVDDRWSTALDDAAEQRARFVISSPPPAPLEAPALAEAPGEAALAERPDEPAPRAPALPVPSAELGEVVTFDEAPFVELASAAPAASAEQALAAISSQRPSMVESASEPTSALAEAIERVARELKPEPGEPGAIWSSGGDDLRARRPASTPPTALAPADPVVEAEPRPVPIGGDSTTPVSVAIEERLDDSVSISAGAAAASASLPVVSASIGPASASASIAPAPSVPPGALRRLRQRVRRSAARRRARAPATRAQRAAVAAVVGGLALIGVWRFWSPGRDASPAPAERVASSESARDVAGGAPSDSGAPAAAPRDTAQPAARPATARPEGSAAAEGEPDGASLAPNQGWLRVDGSPDRHVYLNGSRAGETGAWLRVSCGWRYARIAEPGPPPAGKSFPMWAAEGVPVLVPCRGRTSVRLER